MGLGGAGGWVVSWASRGTPKWADPGITAFVMASALLQHPGSLSAATGLGWASDDIQGRLQKKTPIH